MMIRGIDLVDFFQAPISSLKEAVLQGIRCPNNSSKIKILKTFSKVRLERNRASK